MDDGYKWFWKLPILLKVGVNTDICDWLLGGNWGGGKVMKMLLSSPCTIPGYIWWSYMALGGRLSCIDISG
jgi:hypothetical protein